MRNWIILAIVAVIAYFVWRKYGSNITGAISSVTA